jgi:tight adherence protein C
MQLTAAGYRALTAEAFHGYRVLLTFGLPSLLLLDAAAKGSLSLKIFVVIALCGLLGWRLPAIVVRQRAQARLAHIDRQLPELMDLLTATIEAGMGFAGSLQLVADRMQGPLGEELRLTAQEQAMGLSTEQALDKMIERCDTPAMRSFSRAIHQAEALGTSIGSILRNLASETRKRRRQAAQERIQKAPVKLLFPLVFLIFPALLLVLLYPAMHQIFVSLGAA